MPDDDRKIDIRHFLLRDNKQATQETWTRGRCPLICFKSIIGKSPMKMVGLTGLEPVTLRLSSACSNQLSYRPKI
jgi:hypothetical protein